jgi:hypothetical protein
MSRQPSFKSSEAPVEIAAIGSTDGPAEQLPPTLDEQIGSARQEFRRLHALGDREAVHGSLGHDIDVAGAQLARLLREKRLQDQPSLFSRLGRVLRLNKTPA